jgi:D-sedoheptulose 7-phosphate isomerase
MYSVDRAFEILRACFANGNTLYLCGNGGSAADCNHIAAELIKGMDRNTTGLAAVSMCANVAAITAIANDIGYEWIFSQQLYACAIEGDVLLAISTSGKSKNVINALKQAREMSVKTIALIGGYADKVEPYCDLVIACPGANASEIQEQHIKIYHELCRRLEEDFFP